MSINLVVSPYRFGWFHKEYKICLIGPDGGGKTILFRLLSDGKLVHKGIGITSNNQEKDNIKIIIKNSKSEKVIHSILINKLIDTPGQTATDLNSARYFKDRKKALESADIVLYILRANYNNDVIDNQIDASKLLLSQINAIKKPFKKFLFIANYYSKYTWFDSDNPANIPEVPNFNDEDLRMEHRNILINKLSDDFKDFQLNCSFVDYIVGSLSIEQYASILVGDICQKLKEK